jgi:hypothetical protein
MQPLSSSLSLPQTLKSAVSYPGWPDEFVKKSPKIKANQFFDKHIHHFSVEKGTLNFGL